MGLQAALRLLFPPQCLLCETLVTTDFGLCGPCWRATPFVAGLVCDLCGCPLPGEDPGHPVHCDECLTSARPWDHGRAAMLYRDNARKLVLALKHGDRLDLARPAAGWILGVARPLLSPGVLVVPVPLHWTRLLGRRYNQSALLSAELARQAGLDHCPDALVRGRNTHSQEGRSREGRFDNMTGAILPHPKRGTLLRGRRVLIVDDVMTSGATLAAATEACHGAGATHVTVAVLARVAKDA
ncbi:ComF family protein [Cereibacter azotoformans]|uniref:ComF family protein n=1 Tax=Cereibacter azotoformans TaxID=43057 RepID=UPI000C6E90D1|nr:ComF family protein [Cereibacter azotoformans]